MFLVLLVFFPDVPWPAANQTNLFQKETPPPAPPPRSLENFKKKVNESLCSPPRSTFISHSCLVSLTKGKPVLFIAALFIIIIIIVMIWIFFFFWDLCVCVFIP